ncbi:hypothetical protein GCM10023264_11470 [Sphingomonas daechungensis]|uniref:MarR family transcriptional regulator n=1 Tax=Sphingomonas daechungensis TaxID=1176646 RepID=A0ABX6T780_9SPHN|nr:hypothetical protein [Sphingomonas daechungensis]QNP42417.1 hypothetical protein H9L15_08825 [Sphingomonas daechungensis]QNP44558.1 hypothetical protein H9L15_15795 [Sphingomonas daechungensis]
MRDPGHERFKRGGQLPASPDDPSPNLPEQLFSRIESDRRALKHEARRILTLRQRRAKHFGAATFGEPGWEMLLLLYVSTGSGLGVDQLAMLSGVSEGIARRWLSHLASEKLVQVSGLSSSATVILTPRGRAGLDAFLSDALAGDRQRR